MSTRFTLNPAGIKALQMSPQMLTGLKLIGEEIAEGVREVAPIGDPEMGEHYVDMITVDVGIELGRAVARVNANKFTALWLEFGTGEPGPTPAFAPLRRGAESRGIVLIGARS